MNLQRQVFAHQGIKMSYFLMGQGSPLLFLPGGLRVTTYLQNIALLAKTNTVIALDLPGFGKSTTPSTVWGLEDYATFISAFLDSLGIKKIPVVGHSYGGGVGLYLAMQNRQVSKLIVFSPMGVASRHSRISFYYNVLIKKTLHDYLALQSDRLRAIIFNNAISTVTENITGVKKMLQITNKVLYRNTEPEALAKIAIPVKLVWGRYDELFPVENGKYLHQHISTSQLEILEGNHDWITINPIEGTQKINYYLNR